MIGLQLSLSAFTFASKYDTGYKSKPNVDVMVSSSTLYSLWFTLFFLSTVLQCISRNAEGQTPISEI